MTGCHGLSLLPGGRSRCCEDPGSRLESLCPVEHDQSLEKSEHLVGCVLCFSDSFLKYYFKNKCREGFIRFPIERKDLKPRDHGPSEWFYCF